MGGGWVTEADRLTAGASGPAPDAPPAGK